MRKSIPIVFVPQLAVGEAGLFDMLGLNDPRDGRTPMAKKKSAYNILRINGIKKLPGRLFSVRAIERALACRQ